MKICMLVEGSYPYVTGGVSSWVQMLITAMPEHQFIIYSIAAEEANKGNFKYKLPGNVVEVREVFLDSILNLHSPPTGHYPLSPAEKANLAALIRGEGDLDLAGLIQIFRARAGKNALELFMSFDFFDVIKTTYQQSFSRLPFTDFFWTVRSMLLPLFFLIRQDLPDADIYHSVATGYAGAVGGLAATVYNKPFLLTEHGIYSREREEEIIKSNWAQGEFKNLWINYFYSLARLSYQKASQVFSLFEKNRQIQISLGCAAEKISIIPNGIDIRRFAGADITEARGPLTVGAVVRVVPVKDLVTMLRSFSLVKRALPDAHFLIVGPTDENREYYEECLKVVENLELSDVTFTGNVQIDPYLNQIDILVLSSISEGQPLAMLEGMASRKPFVTTDVGSCRELLYGSGDAIGQAGIIVPMMDFVEMSRAIVRLACDNQLRTEMGNNGYQRVAQFYTLDRLIENYREVYLQTYQAQQKAAG